MSSDTNIRENQVVTLKRTIIALARASAPDRALDAAIAEGLGWTVKTEDFSEGQISPPQVRHIWFNPQGQPDKVPKYTWNLDLALELVESIEPARAGGFGWQAGNGSAKINDLKPALATTPIIAVCMQALLLKLRQLQ